MTTGNNYKQYIVSEYIRTNNDMLNSHLRKLILKPLLSIREEKFLHNCVKKGFISRKIWYKNPYWGWIIAMDANMSEFNRQQCIRILGAEMVKSNDLAIIHQASLNGDITND